MNFFTCLLIRHFSPIFDLKSVTYFGTGLAPIKTYTFISLFWGGHDEKTKFNISTI